jgi:IS5 family transposase
VDRDSKLIKTYEVTDASVHDSQVVVGLLEKQDADTELYADSAFRARVRANHKDHERVLHPLDRDSQGTIDHRTDQFGVQHATRSLFF